MAEQLDIDADPFLVLLTDALRAGPGSPEWRQAVTKLRADGVGGARDEYAMLVAVREHIESGKDYRGVRAGPGFTRRLMERIDEEAAAATGRRRAWPLATIIASIGAVVLVAVVAVLLIVLRPNEATERAAELARLRNDPFAQTVAQASFDRPLPASWTSIGPLAVDASAGLRPAATTRPSTDYQSAGIEATVRVPPGESGTIEALLVAPPTGDAATTADLVVQVFAQAEPSDPTRSGVPAEIVWVLQGGKGRVALPSGRTVGEPLPFNAGKEGQLVRIAVGPRTAVVSAAGRELYAGPNDLPPDRARVFGVRFLTKGGPASPSPIVLSARVAKP